MVSNCWTQIRSNPTSAMTPLLNSVEIQAQVPAITAMTIRKKAIDPRSSPTLCLLLPCFYLVCRLLLEKKNKCPSNCALGPPYYTVLLLLQAERFMTFGVCL